MTLPIRIQSCATVRKRIPFYKSENLSKPFLLNWKHEVVEWKSFVKFIGVSSVTFSGRVGLLTHNVESRNIPINYSEKES